MGIFGTNYNFPHMFMYFHLTNSYLMHFFGTNYSEDARSYSIYKYLTSHVEDRLEAETKLAHSERIILLDAVTQSTDSIPVFLSEYCIVVQAQ